jgi:hypothetical protein
MVKLWLNSVSSAVLAASVSVLFYNTTDPLCLEEEKKAGEWMEGVGDGSSEPRHPSSIHASPHNRSRDFTESRDLDWAVPDFCLVGRRLGRGYWRR